jgi:hypothetical protein
MTENRFGSVARSGMGGARRLSFGRCVRHEAWKCRTPDSVRCAEPRNPGGEGARWHRDGRTGAGRVCRFVCLSVSYRAPTDRQTTTTRPTRSQRAHVATQLGRDGSLHRRERLPSRDKPTDHPQPNGEADLSTTNMTERTQLASSSSQVSWSKKVLPSIARSREPDCRADRSGIPAQPDERWDEKTQPPAGRRKSRLTVATAK